MKKQLLALVLALLLCMGLAVTACAETVAKDTCGTDVQWELDSTGKLTISGTGEMADYTIVNKAPWYSHSSSITSVVIADGVTHIGNYAFCNHSKVTSVSIPGSVETIGENAFSDCSALNSVTISEGVNKTIGPYAFYGCRALESVTIPGSVTTIDDNAFMFCSKLESVTIPGSVTTIDENAFMFCSNLTSVTIPGSVTSFGNAAFHSCGNLKTVTISKGVTTIGSSAFHSCGKLTTVSIPDSVTSIGSLAFNGCTALKSVTIPGSVTSIDYNAFYGCSSLETVEYHGLNEPDCGPNVFDGTNVVAVKVPVNYVGNTGDTFATKNVEKTLPMVPLTYTITYMNSNNTKIEGLSPAEYTSGTGATLPTLGNEHMPAGVSSASHHFGGWYVDAAFTSSPVTEITAAEWGDKTFYAKWEAHNPDKNGLCSCGEKFVAKVGITDDTEGTDDTYYSNFAEALDAWTDDTTLTLLVNVPYADDIRLEGESVTRTFNGGDHTLSLGNHTLTNFGILNITGGTITAEGVKAVAIYNSGTLNITVGTITAEGEEAIAINNFGELTITGGTITAKGDNVISISNNFGTMSISGGMMTAEGQFAAAISNFGTLTISDGTMTTEGEYAAAISNFGTLTISDGTITADGVGAIAINNEGMLNITRGTVSAPANNAFAVANGGTMTLNGEYAVLSGFGGIDNWRGGILNLINGSVTASTQYALNNSGTATLSGANLSTESNNYTVASSGTTTISGGTLESEGAAVIMREGGTLTITTTGCQGWEIVNNSAAVIGHTGSNAKIILPDGYSMYNDTTGEIVEKMAEGEIGIICEEIFTVTFDPNGGIGTMEPQTFIDNRAKELAYCEFVRDGYTFVGWKTAADGSGDEFGDMAKVTLTESITLYAQWKANICTVTFDANGGIGTMEPQTFNVGEAQKLSGNTFWRPGYTFAGWKDEAGETYADQESVTLSEDITLYAQWSFIPIQLDAYTVRFDANGGEGTMDALTFYEGLPQKLPVNSFVREGYTFDGWTTEPDGQGYYYGDGWNITVSEDMTLYAQWKKNAPAVKPEYKIEVDGSKGTVTRLNDTSVVHEEMYIRYAVSGTIDGEPFMVVDLIDVKWDETQMGVVGTFSVPNLQSGGSVDNKSFVITTDDSAHKHVISDVMPNAYGVLVK